MQLRTLLRMSMLVATAIILYRFSFRLPLFPAFLKYDASDVTVVVGALAFGPAAGVGIELVKNLLHALLKGGANPVGLLANFIAGCSLIYGTALVYRMGMGRPWRWLAVLSGAGVMALIMLPLNLFIFLPAHGIKAEVLTSMAIQTFTPFNFVKGMLNAGLGVVLYERLALALGSEVGMQVQRSES